MTLPSSGSISLFGISDEFGLAHSTPFPAGFYGKGGAPSSGALSFADFYGRSSASFTPDGGSVSAEDYGSASVVLTCSSTATWTYTGGGVGGSATIANGGTGTSIAFIVTTTNVTRTRTWNVTGTAGGVTRTFTVTVTADADFNF